MRQPSLDQLLTTYSENFMATMADEFIASKAMGTPVNVKSRTGRYWQYGINQAYAPETLHEPEDETNGVKHKKVQLLYALEDHRIKETYSPVDVEENPEGESGERRERTELVTYAGGIRREIDVASLFATATQTAAATAAWGTGGSNPIEDFRSSGETVRKNSGRYPNMVTLSADSWSRLQTDANFKDYAKGSINNGVISVSLVENLLTELWNKKVQVNVGTSIYNSAPESVTPAFTSTEAWGTSDVFVYYQGAFKRDASFVRCFANTKRSGIVSWRGNDEAQGATSIAWVSPRDDRLTNQECGFKITGA